MFKRIFFLIIFHFVCYAQSQIQDLESLATGKNVQFSAIFEENTEVLYGYFVLYNKDKTNEISNNYEYIILDKNLNKIANKDFVAETTLKKYNVSKNKNLLSLFPIVDNEEIDKIGLNNFIYPLEREINLEDNSIYIKIQKCFENNTLINCPENKKYSELKKEQRKEKNKNGYNYYSSVYEINDKKYLVFDYNVHKNYISDNRLMMIDENLNKKWEYKYNTNPQNYEYKRLKIIDVDKDNNKIFAILSEIYKNNINYRLIVLDLLSGNELNNQDLQSAFEKIGSSTYVETTLKHLLNLNTNIGLIDNKKITKDKIQIFGRQYEFEIAKYEDINGNGYLTLTIDKNTYQVNVKIISFENDIKQKIPEIKYTGYFDDGFYLDLRDVYFLSNNKIGILAEKFKPSNSVSKLRAGDLYYILTNENFELEGIQKFNKIIGDTSKISDYLFSQYLNEKNNIAFFYLEEVPNAKDKKENIWNLYINIFDGKNFKQEKVQISEKDNFTVIPYVAKEGYILLREFNEKEKFNKIRLERLNY